MTTTTRGRTMRAPHPVNRRLKALIRDGHGPDKLAALLDEPADLVMEWASGKRCPEYILPTVVAVFDRLAGEIGDDKDAAEYARARRWRGAMSWYGIDIDDPKAIAWVSAQGTVTQPKNLVDPEQVENAVGGWAYRADLTASELAIVVTRLAGNGKGLTARQIAKRLRWAGTDSVDDATRDAVNRYASSRRIKVKSEVQGPPHGWYGPNPRKHRRTKPSTTIDAGMLRAEPAA